MDRKSLTHLVSAFLLGDGYLRKWHNGVNAAYCLSQTDDHADYVEWQESIVGQLTRVTKRHYPSSMRDGITRKGYFKLETACLPFFTVLYDRTYSNGRKSISVHDASLFDWQSAAIWYMDDGYILCSEDMRQRGSVFLCTDNYSHAEVIFLQKMIYEKLDIPFNIRKRGTRKDGTTLYRLVVTKDNAKRFCEGVAPYMFPSFEYKLTSERVSPVLQGDDIVSSYERS